MLMSGDRDALRVGRMVEARVRGVSVRCPCCVVYMRGTPYRVYARHSCRFKEPTTVPGVPICASRAAAPLRACACRCPAV
jgi:hypothetical protein